MQITCKWLIINYVGDSGLNFLQHQGQVERLKFIGMNSLTMMS